MSFFNDLVQQYRVTFEGQKSWVGSFQDAQKEIEEQRLKATYLKEECAICLGNFLANEQVIVLPCGHGLHERCFTPWNKDKCPYDQLPIAEIFKIKCLGYSVTFPPKTHKFGLWLAQHSDQINAHLQNIIIEMLNKYSMELKISSESERAQPLNKLLIDVAGFAHLFLQEFLNAYDGELPLQNIPAKIYAIVENAPHIFEAAALAKKMDINLDLKSILNPNSKNLPLESFLFLPLIAVHFIQSVTKLSIDSDSEEMRRATFFMGGLLAAISSAPYLKKLAEDLDQRFFTHHFKAIGRLPSDDARYSYLSKMNVYALERLNRLTQGGGKTSIRIRTTIAKINTYKKIQRIAELGVMSILGLGGTFLFVKSQKFG